MTAGKVMSAIKVDNMCQRLRAPMAGGAADTPIIAAQPNVLDVMRARRRTAARVCLFGAPEPGATRALYDQMLERESLRVLQRYEFDVKAERYVGDAAALEQAVAAEQAAVGNSVDQLQQRLGKEEEKEDKSVEAAEVAAAVEAKADSVLEQSETADVTIAPTTSTSTVASSSAASKVRPSKSSASLRHSTKPYDKPASSTAAVRPITEFFRKSKKTCPTATMAAAKLTSAAHEANTTSDAASDLAASHHEA